MEIIVIVQKLGKHGDKSPVVFLDLQLGQRRWEEIKVQIEEDRDFQLYCDCELWRGDPTNLDMVDHIRGHYT